jgi:hypothetical protein
MSKLPRRPDLDRLRALEPDIIELPVGTELHQIYFRGGKHPTLWHALRYFGPTNARFDHHQPDEDGEGQMQERGVAYYAPLAITCLAEVFQGPPRLINRERGKPWLVAFPLQSPVSLIDLTGKFALRAGASMKLMTGPKSYSQNWSRGFYDVYAEIHGLYYPSSLTNEPTIALNERAKPVFPPTPSFNRPLSDPALLTPLRNAARKIHYGLL